MKNKLPAMMSKCKQELSSIEMLNLYSKKGDDIVENIKKHMDEDSQAINRTDDDIDNAAVSAISLHKVIYFAVKKSLNYISFLKPK